MPRIETNECRNFEIEAKFTSSLSTEQVLSIVEGGIKLLLFQRGQIPQPFDMMSDQKKDFSGDSYLSENRIVNEELEDKTWETKLLSPRERIVYFRKKMKEVRDKKKLLKLLNRIETQEIACRNMFEESFTLIRSLFKKVNVINGSVVAIVFGTSINNPKDVYLFHVHEDLIEDSNENLENNPLHMRRFFKSLITNPDLIGLNPLKKTFTHICLFVKNPIDEQIDLRFVENPTFHLNAKRNKFTTFNIKLVKNELRKDSNDDSLFDYNSHICYQLPFRFKGFECKRRC